jgi:hypothetical protein
MFISICVWLSCIFLFSVADAAEIPIKTSQVDSLYSQQHQLQQPRGLLLERQQPVVNSSDTSQREVLSGPAAHTVVIYMEDINIDNPALLISIAHKCSSARVLKIIRTSTDATPLTPEHMLLLTAYFPTITELYLENLELFTATALELAQGFKKLKKIVISSTINTAVLIELSKAGFVCNSVPVCLSEYTNLVKDEEYSASVLKEAIERQDGQFLREYIDTKTVSVCDITHVIHVLSIAQALDESK